MILRISSSVLSLVLVLLTSGHANAAWSGPQEIINGAWGSETCQFGLRSEDGFSVIPSIEAITPEKHVIISDPFNRKQLVFSGDGTLINVVKWDATPQKEGNAAALLSQRDLLAGTVHSLKASASTYRIIIVFNDRNVTIISDHAFRSAVRDTLGFVYGIAMDRVVRFDRNGRKAAELIVPRAHEELIAVPGQRAPRGVYIEFGEPIVAPNGDVYVWQKSDDKYRILKWTWHSAPNPGQRE